MAERLPIPGSDNGTWGTILNGYLGVSLGSDGTLQPSALTQAGAVQIGGDIGGTAAVPHVTATHLSAALPISQGGTGSTTQNFADLNSTQVLSNKLVRPSSGIMVAVGTTYTPNPLNEIQVILNPTTNFTLSNASGVDGQKMLVRITSNTTAFVVTWGTAYKSSGVATLPTTLVASKTITCGFIYDAIASAWILMAVDAVGY